jgi:hypothetical protein
MRANGTFTVKAFNPASLTPEPVIAAALHLRGDGD